MSSTPVGATDPALAYAAGAAAVAGLMAYAVFGGADFGGGVWDLFATGPRKREQRDAIARAMGPVWEANHVWLVFVIVILFTCFPAGYSRLAVALFLPFHLALLGIMLRGAAFVFRGFAGGRAATGAPGGGRREWHVPAWSVVFGIASVVSPFFLGAAFGAVTVGGGGHASPVPAWLRPYSVGCGLLALSACAYLAAVYLTVETEGPLRDDFRRRAILAGTATAALAGVVLALAGWQARWFFDQLLSRRAAPVLVAGVACFGLSAWAVFGRRYALGRAFAAAEVVLLLAGWAVAQEPYLAYPDLGLVATAAPPATIRFVLWSLPAGAALILPSLLYLLSVFKRSDNA